MTRNWSSQQCGSNKHMQVLHWQRESFVLKKQPWLRTEWKAQTHHTFGKLDIPTWEISLFLTRRSNYVPTVDTLLMPKTTTTIIICTLMYHCKFFTSEEVKINFWNIGPTCWRTHSEIICVLGFRFSSSISDCREIISMLAADFDSVSSVARLLQSPWTLFKLLSPSVTTRTHNTVTPKAKRLLEDFPMQSMLLSTKCSTTADKNHTVSTWYHSFYSNL